MTEKLYDLDSHLKEFYATVLSCDENKVVLDKTAFFPEGGGQTADKGYIGGVRVVDVYEKNGLIYHIVKENISVGEKVFCTIDWEERFDKMQNHSGEHIISGIVNSLYGYDNVGFHLSDTEMTMDFNGMLCREDFEKIELLANKVIYRNASFKCFYPKDFENLKYRSKLDLTENVRIVEIDGCDRCACCAPHVNSASEIGMIKILDFCKNKDGVRVWAVCGNRALSDYNMRYKNASEISALLCSPQNEIADAVKKQLKNIESLKYETVGLKNRLISEVVNGFKITDKISVLFQEDFEIKELQILADKLHRKSDGAVAVFSGEKAEYSFVFCDEKQKTDIWFAKFKEKLAVRGGGKNGMVQGTVSATKEQILGVINELDGNYN